MTTLPPDEGNGLLLNEEFAAFFRAHYADVVRYVLRRVDDDVAEDVAVESFVVAWRQWADLPKMGSDVRGGDATRAYVFGIARRLILANRRESARRVALGVRLTDPAVLQADSPGPEDSVPELVDLAGAWLRLRDQHQEALAMTYLDDLTSEQAGRVLGISAVAFRVRLTRARAALRAQLGVGAGSALKGTSSRETSSRGLRVVTDRSGR